MDESTCHVMTTVVAVTVAMVTRLAQYIAVAMVTRLAQ